MRHHYLPWVVSELFKQALLFRYGIIYLLTTQMPNTRGALAGQAKQHYCTWMALRNHKQLLWWTWTCQVWGVTACDILCSRFVWDAAHSSASLFSGSSDNEGKTPKVCRILVPMIVGCVTQVGACEMLHLGLVLLKWVSLCICTLTKSECPSRGTLKLFSLIILS